MGNSCYKYIETIKLNRLRSDNIDYFSLRGYYVAKCVDVYDGDTCTVIIKFKNTYYRINVRLNGIDTPEIRTKNSEEKEAALKAKYDLEKLIKGKIVDLFIQKLDKYGRPLADMYVEYENSTIHVVSYMLNELKHGYAYNGGTKQKFSGN